MKPIWLFVFFYSIILAGCQRKAIQVSVRDTPAPVSSSFDKDEKLLFLSLQMEGNENFKVEKVTLMQAKIAIGRSKSNPDERKEEGSITLAFIASDGSLLQEYTVANPLIRRLEYANAAGELQTREVKAKKLEYTFRSNIPPGAVKLFIHATDTGKKLLEVSLD